MFLPLVAMAEIIPSERPFDPRVRLVDYNPFDVVRVTTFYGVSTYIEFSSEESIKEIAMGDDVAWNILPRGNHLFIKPKEKKADTNITVVTDKRVYHFSLYVVKRALNDDTAWRDNNLVYGLIFRYPDAEAKKKAKIESEQAQKLVVEDILNRRAAAKGRLKMDLYNATKLDRDAAGLPDTPAVSKLNKEKDVKQIYPQEVADNNMNNFNYWVAGSELISPTGARDDGRFTYLLFSNNRDMPAVYMEDESGKESLINTHVEGNTIVVHHVIPKLKLRRGDAVACLLNKGFDYGAYNDRSGTVSSDVKRTVKEAE
jgi:type IV secretion system protein VirB9